MSENAGGEVVETAPEEDADFAKRLAAGTGGGDWHLTEEDKAHAAMLEAAEAGNEEADFAKRLAAGTGGGEWWRTDDDHAAAAAQAAEDPAIVPYVDSGLTPEQQTTIAASNPTSATPEPQAPSQPGPTPGAESPSAVPAGESA